MRADPAEFRRLDLRCHGLLRDVPLHDVWTITLTGGGPGRTMQDVVAVSPFRTGLAPNVLVRALFGLRRALGRLFRWDEPRHDRSGDSYVGRLTDDDRARSLLAPSRVPVKPVSRLTGVYMTLIDPFRRVIVYPALIRAMQRAWSAAYA